jgi:DNA-binding response OmpR family regulator
VILLLAEDDVLIGLHLEDGFRDVGYEVAGPFTTCVAATTWLKSHSPIVALVSYNLQDGPCTDLVRELRGRGIPFAIYSGSLHKTVPPEFQGAPWIDKPASFSLILDTITAVTTASTIMGTDA